MKKIGHWLQGIILLCLTLVVTANGVLLVKRLAFHEELPSLFGYSTVTVLSGSMEPEFSPGDMLVIHKQETYQTGDIVTYQIENSFVTHRIVEQTEGAYLTKGDANNAADSRPVAPSQIYGKVALTIPGIGNVVLFFKSTLGTLVFIVLFLALVELSLWRGKRDKTGEES